VAVEELGAICSIHCIYTFIQKTMTVPPYQWIVMMCTVMLKLVAIDSAERQMRNR
jgi:hypothetical protein